MSDNLFKDEHPVPDEKVRFFQENGYVHFNDVLCEEEVEVLRKGLAEALADKKGFVRDLAGKGKKKDKLDKDKILQMLNLWENHDTIAPYSLSPRIGKMAQRLTGSKNVHLFHDQALIKEPGPSAPSPWHQDQPYWPTKEPGMISCWMALDDVTVERGCMQFIPGSHQWGEFPPIDFGDDPMTLKSHVPEHLQENWKPVPVEMGKGSCTFHHGLTFHYTNANTTDMVRRALVTIYIPDGVTYAAEDKMPHPLSDSITSKKGEYLRGTRFPKLM